MSRTFEEKCAFIIILDLFSRPTKTSAINALVYIPKIYIMTRIFICLFPCYKSGEPSPPPHQRSAVEYFAPANCGGKGTEGPQENIRQRSLPRPRKLEKRMSVTWTKKSVRRTKKNPHHLSVKSGSSTSVTSDRIGDVESCLLTVLGPRKTSLHSHSQKEEPLQLPVIMRGKSMNRILASSNGLYKYRRASFSPKSSLQIDMRKRAYERPMEDISFEAEAEGALQKIDRRYGAAVSLVRPADCVLVMEGWNKILAFQTSFGEAFVMRWRVLAAREEIDLEVERRHFKDGTSSVGELSPDNESRNLIAVDQLERGTDPLSKVLGARIMHLRLLLLGMVDCAVRSLCPHTQLVQREAYRSLNDALLEGENRDGALKHMGLRNGTLKAYTQLFSGWVNKMANIMLLWLSYIPASLCLGTI